MSNRNMRFWHITTSTVIPMPFESKVELIYMYDLILLRGSFCTCWVIFVTDFFLIWRNKNLFSDSIYLIPWAFSLGNTPKTDHY